MDHHQVQLSAVAGVEVGPGQVFQGAEELLVVSPSAVGYSVMTTFQVAFRWGHRAR